jgi:hypothetical protein
LYYSIFSSSIFKNEFEYLKIKRVFLSKIVKVGDLEKKDKQQSQKIKQLLSDLESGNATKITNALNSLQVNGDISILRPLVTLLKTDISEDTITEILDFLGDLKVSKAAPEMISILRDENFLDQRQQILTTIWNSKVDYSEYIAEFVEIACDGTFMEAFECLTVLENLEGPFEERHILECQLHLKDYIEDTTAKDIQKAQVMSEIAILIKGFDLDVDNDD